MRAEGYSTLEELQAHYTGGDEPMSPLNYVWYQHRWLWLAAKMFEADGEDGWCDSGLAFDARDRVNAAEATAASLGAAAQNRSQPDPRAGGPRLALALLGPPSSPNGWFT